MKNRKLWYVIGILMLLSTLIICSCIGPADIGWFDAVKIICRRIPFLNIDVSDIQNSKDVIIWQIRFPRVLTGAMVGGALAVAGVTYQGLLRNSMADPYVIGISSGAAFGAAIGIMSKITFSFLGMSFISIMAFTCAIAVVLIVYNIARIGNKLPMTTLLLSGIAIGQFLTALTSLIMIFSEKDMQRIIFWTMGSLSGKGWDQVAVVFPYAMVGILVIYCFAKDLNIILLGEDTANNLGVNVERIKSILLIVSAIVTAAAVSVSGIIGFVGLIIPHIVRMATGPDHKVLIPMSFIAGAILMVVCDTLARSVMSQEIPVGIITAILGGPFFIYLLRNKRKEVI